MSHQYRMEGELVPSEFDWIGRYPSEWLRTRLGYHIEFITGFAFKSEGFSFDSGVKLVRGDNVTEGHLRWGEKTRFWPEITCDISKYTLQAGDVLIGMDGSKVGKNYACVKEADLPLLLVQRVARLRSTGAICETFLTYLIGSRLFKIWTTLVKTDPAIPHISPDDINGFPVVLPSYDEQKQIALFLDYETSKIDALISKQQQLIALLGEKRQAVISHAVTKGLNPDAPMRDSGIEWLGEVPERWEVKQLRNVSTQLGGGTPSKDNASFWEGDIPWVSPKDMKVDYIDTAQDSITEIAVRSSSAKLIPVGSVLIVVRGMILDHSVPTALTMKPLTVNQDMKAVLPGKELNGEFLLFFFSGMRDYLLSHTYSSAHGTKVMSIEKLERTFIGLPDPKEQAELVSQLKDRLEKLDVLIAKSNGAMELLQERRTALISAAVTGKIDVRGWKPPSSARMPETEMEVA